MYFPWFIQPNRTVILQLLALLDQFTSATIEDILSSAADNDDDGDDGGPVDDEEEEGGKEKKEEEEVAYFGRMACLCLQLVCAHVSSLAANGVTAVDAGWVMATTAAAVTNTGEDDDDEWPRRRDAAVAQHGSEVALRVEEEVARRR